MLSGNTHIINIVIMRGYEQTLIRNKIEIWIKTTVAVLN